MIENGLSQSQEQQLHITPQQQQSLKILQLERAELSELVEKELMENPVLEEESSLAADQEKNDNKLQPEAIEFYEPENSFAEATALDASYARSYAGSGGESESPSSEWREDRAPTTPVSLQEFLASQLGLADLSTHEKQIAQFIFANLDDNGYLELSDKEILIAAKASVEELDRVWTTVRALEPAGIGARNLSECLLNQLQQKGRHNGLEARILRYHADLLAKGRPHEIAKREDVTLSEVTKAIGRLRELNPFPGRQFQAATAQSITADLFVQKVNGRYVVSANDDGLPKLRISKYYRTVVAESGRTPERNYLRERLRSASWLVRCIYQRQQTIQKVAQCIVDLQQPFFEEGVEALRPVHMKEIAAKVGLHESTISRAIANKYIETPRGLFELKYFFTSRLQTSSGDISSHLVKEVIRSMIEREDRDEPLSDYAIADALNQGNIKIARRTVTKYREALRIPTAPHRSMQRSMQRGVRLEAAAM